MKGALLATQIWDPKSKVTKFFSVGPVKGFFFVQIEMVSSMKLLDISPMEDFFLPLDWP